MAEPLCFADARAVAVALGAACRTGAETVPLGLAHRRVAAEDVASGVALPGFAASAMDGYAVRSGDTADAPVVLRLVDEARAGHPASRAVGPGEATRISTGAALPAGADAVVRIEDATESGDDHSLAGPEPGVGARRAAQDRPEGDRGAANAAGHAAQDRAAAPNAAEGTPAPRVHVRAPAAPGHDVRQAGDDVGAGDRLVRAGDRLHAGRIALLAGAGVAAVPCRRPPTATVVVTGDEVVPLGAPLGPGDVHDVNGLALTALLRDAGADVVAVVHVPDDRSATEQALARADTDLVVSCGGVSVGRHDHVRAAWTALGARALVPGVALQPGKPTWIGSVPRVGAADRVAVALPGNPGAAVVVAALLVAPLVRAMLGGPARDASVARLAAATHGHPTRVRALRATTTATADGVVLARVLDGQQPHRLRSLAAADAVVLLPPGASPAPVGALVEVVPVPGASASAR